MISLLCGCFLAFSQDGVLGNGHAAWKIAPGLLLLLLLLFTYYRQYKPLPPLPPQNINRVQGKLFRKPKRRIIPNGRELGPAPPTGHAYVDGILPIIFEDGLLKRFPQLLNRPHQLDIRVEDRKLIGVQGLYSIDEEYRRFPPIEVGYQATSVIALLLGLWLPSSCYMWFHLKASWLPPQPFLILKSIASLPTVGIPIYLLCLAMWAGLLAHLIILPISMWRKRRQTARLKAFRAESAAPTQQP